MAKAGRSTHNPQNFHHINHTAQKAGREVRGIARAGWTELAESGMVVVAGAIFLVLILKAVSG